MTNTRVATEAFLSVMHSFCCLTGLGLGLVCITAYCVQFLIYSTFVRVVLCTRSAVYAGYVRKVRV